jgi:hypothetical protein
MKKSLIFNQICLFLFFSNHKFSNKEDIKIWTKNNKVKFFWRKFELLLTKGMIMEKKDKSTSLRKSQIK